MNNLIKQRIVNYFNGQLSPEEEVGLLAWLKESEANRNYFFQIKENLDPEKMEHPLLKSSYSGLINKLLIGHPFKSVSPGRVKKIRLSFARVAAMLLVAIFTGFAAAHIFIGKSSESIPVTWFSTYVPRGEKSQLLLPDGSKVWLNAESVLSYPGNFMENNRQVKLEGEAYFEVAKQEGSDFTVETRDYEVRVTGTRFNVMAYPDFHRTEAILIEGKIEIRKGRQIIDVEPGQTLIFKEDQFLLEKTDAVKAANWKDGIFDFDKITFEELVKRLERWYDVDMEIINPGLNKISYSGVFKNEETIDEVLTTLQVAIPFHYTRDGFRKFRIEINESE
ncbi:MAG: FecR domain-containing protein [Prolixibacteraceae bacterium]